MQRNFSPVSKLPASTPKEETYAEHIQAQAEANQHCRDVIARHGVDLALYEDFRWHLARHAGCSVERLDEVLARFLQTFDLHSSAH